MRRILFGVGVFALTSAALITPSATARERDSASQERATYSLRGLNVAADIAMTNPPSPGCEFVGTWTGSSFVGDKVTLTLDVHADGSVEGWIAQGPSGFGAGGEDYEIVFVNRVNWKIERVRPISHVRPSSDDLASGMDVYLCPKPKKTPLAQPVVVIQSIDPLTLLITPPAGTSWTGNIVVTTPPGFSEIQAKSLPLAIETPFTTPITIQTSTSFPVVPMVLPQFNGGPTLPSHLSQPLAIQPAQNNGVGFVWSVTPNQTLWRPVFLMTVQGQPFAFPGPRIFNAYDTQTITLILPASVVPPGTGLEDVQLTIPSSSPLNQTPPEAYAFTRAPTLRFQGGGETDVLTLTSTIFNPTNTDLAFTNDSFGVILNNCQPGSPLSSVRTTMTGTLPAFSNMEVLFEFDARLASVWAPDIEPPDPLSPTFREDLEDWLLELCADFDTRPALTLP